MICYQMPLFVSVYDAIRIDFSTSVFRGVFKSANFPVRRFGPAPAIGDTTKYLNLDVLVLEFTDAQNESRRYYLHYGGRTEMLLANSGGNLVVGGMTFDEINDVYQLGIPVEIEGQPYKLRREGQTYPVLHVEKISVLDREALPLVVYQRQYVTGRYTPEKILSVVDRVALPQEFYVGRNVTGVILRQTFKIILNPGDRVRIRFNASDPIFFGVYAPNSTLPDNNATRWGVPIFEYNDTKKLDLIMDVFERGTYTYLFDADRTVWTRVRFDCGRVA